jgi:hypothetical protein
MLLSGSPIIWHVTAGVSGGTLSATAINNVSSGSPQLSEVTLTAAGPTANNLSAYVASNSASPVIENSSMTVTHPSPSPNLHAIDLAASAITLRHVKISTNVATGGGGPTVVGIYNSPQQRAGGGPPVVYLDDVEINAFNPINGMVAIENVLGAPSPSPQAVAILGSNIQGTVQNNVDITSLQVYAIDSLVSGFSNSGTGTVTLQCQASYFVNGGTIIDYSATCLKP